jgi:hypothetical protein
MAIKLLRTEIAIEECEKHLIANSAFGTPIESYLTQYSLVTLCAEMQQEVISVAQNRASSISDVGLREFTKNAAKDACKHIMLEHLTGYVGKFGNSRKAVFKTYAASDALTATAYDNAVENRHLVAHSTGVSLTFSEVKVALNSARIVLQWLDSALS